MKKIPLVLLLAFCLCLLIGCHAQEVLKDTAEQLSAGEAPETDEVLSLALDGAADSPTDVTDPETGEVLPPEAYEQPVSSTDVIMDDDAPLAPQLPVEDHAVDFVTLSVEECVADADGAAGQLPRIVLDCPGADAINEDIEGAFRYLVDADYCTLYYTASKTGPVLSLMIAQLYDGEASYYTPYMLDLSTGERMTGTELLGLMELSEDVVVNAELRIMGDEFEYQHGAQSQGEAADFYYEQYYRTVSSDNAELGRLWLDDEGELNFVAKIYSLAGAEFYEYPMGTGFYYR